MLQKDKRVLFEVAVSFFAVILILDIFNFAPLGGVFKKYLSTIAAALFLYVPVVALRRTSEDIASYGFSLSAWKKDLILTAVLCIVVFVPFYPGYHIYQQLFFKNNFKFAAPKDPLNLILGHLFVVSLPEELFYRGYIQGRLNIVFQKRWKVLGAQLGPAVIVVAAMFALGHFLIDFRPRRLGVFFPSFVFSWMRERTGTIAGATLFHALCNIYMAFLEASYFGP